MNCCVNKAYGSIDGFHDERCCIDNGFRRRGDIFVRLGVGLSLQKLIHWGLCGRLLGCVKCGGNFKTWLGRRFLYCVNVLGGGSLAIPSKHDE